MKALLNYGQSMWLDYIRRDLITSGSLKKMIDDDGLRGMTSNPSIFEKAIGESSLYDDMLKSLASRNDLDTTARYEQIAIRDIQDAADILRPVYESSKFRDGYVSLEVSPLLAHKTEETIEEARRLWKAVNRENVMIKVPGTAEGLPAIRKLIGEGININVTLLFAQEVYEKVAEAHIAGLEDLAKRGGNLKKIGERGQFLHQPHRLAGGFDDQRQAESATDAKQQALLKSLLGKVAIANGKLTYQSYQTHLQRAALAGAGGQGSADPARAVGEHQHEESRLSRRDVRRRIDRARHGEYHASGHDRCISRSRKAAEQSDRRCRRRAERDGQSGASRHLDQGSDRPS